MGDRSQAAAATAALYVDGKRRGSAVLIDPTRVLTARHVLEFGGGYVDEVELVFPRSDTNATTDRWRARRVLPDRDSAVTSDADIALLELITVPSAPPKPVELWAAVRPPDGVWVFGYPTAEKELPGVWREFTVAGPTNQGSIQLNWEGGAGSRPGHSGGPVLDADTGALAGVLVEGAEKAQFDRYVPIRVAQHMWRAVPRPWLFAGADAANHFSRRASGQRGVRRNVDLFRGRTTALNAVTAWLSTDEAPGAVMVITGQPGAGKSAVLARTVLDRLPEAGLGLAFHARNSTHQEFLDAFAQLVGASGKVGSSMAAIAEALDVDSANPGAEATVCRIAVDALDEAASNADARQIASSLHEIADDPRVRVVVATRARATRDPGAATVPGLVARLGVRGSDDDSLVDLDSDIYADDPGLVEFCGAMLRQDEHERGNPAGGAWKEYRADPALCGRLAATVAERAQRNFLVAALAADPLSRRRSVLDPAIPSFTPEEIPVGVGDALERYLEALPERQRHRRRGLLTALAYARGNGIDDPLWLRFAAAIGYPAAQDDLDELRESAAADYLLQATHTVSGTPLVRLFHQALADQLVVND